MSLDKKYKRIVIKIGSSSLTHEETGSLNLAKMEKLVRTVCDLRNTGYDVCIVSSGAIAVGRDSLGLKERPKNISTKQACAAVGQGRLMMTYQKLFGEYNQNSGQVLITKNTMVNPVSRDNAKNTFNELFIIWSASDDIRNFNISLSIRVKYIITNFFRNLDDIKIYN